MNNAAKTQQPAIDALLREALSKFPQITQAILFGSLAMGRETAVSDLDIAVAAGYPLTADERIEIINRLAEYTGRPIDLIDLKTVTEPLLGQILRYGQRLLGSDKAYAELMLRHIYEQEDFMPYRNRILAERRQAWIGK